MAPSSLLLASVLKPLDDTRMFGKFGRTLASRPELTVHVAGRRAPRPANAPANLQTHELLAGSRLSLGRLAAQWRYWQLLRQLKPRLVIVHAPELLPLTLLWRGLGRGRSFLYDVRENYALNIQTQQVYPSWVRRTLAGLVRWVETAAAGRAAKLILAERSYADELPFATPAHTVVLENKYEPQPGEPVACANRSLPVVGEPLRLLFSGTISKLNGVYEAVAFASALRSAWPQVELTIIGFCQQPEEQRYLREIAVTHSSWLRVVGGDTLVSHRDIVREIGRSHLGLLPYRPHPSSWDCIPTKLYEYLASGLPVLIPKNPLWQELVRRYKAGATVPFAEGFPPSGIADFLAGRAFYPDGIPQEAFWQTETAKLWQIVDSLP
ncbi:glycosyltransferase family protein [Hymenobacter crusticola]|uniref:Glycosyltransferase subfamily 4-like N-terminal domain-containing protein n=1 Tax=Hymenobacter crusticola TaxID=1770526 RepID=A0A243WFL7_9BACT|nr:hypothetical protein [Hymenobacter crusticola]OUJ74576.1 hypothetical protein BXP70_07300 [Hymenobacter crusticola]